MKTSEKIYNEIKKINESVGIIEVEKINLYPEYRDICKQNTCGGYGRNYTCPPLVGTIEDCMAELRGFTTAIIFRKFYELEDSFDVEGMDEGGAKFKQLCQEIIDIARAIDKDCLILSAGGCRLCSPCGAITNTPCPHPDRALASLESYGIQVSELAQSLSMKYISGQNTVTYFGGVFVKE